MVSEQPTRKVEKQLRDAGFESARTSGSHSVWVKGAVSITVPDGHRTISPGVYRKILTAIKEAE
ncbi:type II toxin-antitoxin system HicA family toxin [uncultured Microbacterium sp.]|uniref:type II toxin-antitoxin system HicA family toxin n=1 Tax=uncultured Microbacterium sp. TaxID=191216 RepID=UPI0035CAA454